MKAPLLWLRRTAAIVVLAIFYGTAAWLSGTLNRRGRNVLRRSGRILVIGTFDNPNWFHSHIRPLVRSGIGEVVLVCDEEVEPMSGVQYECPPAWLRASLSRAAAKFIWGAGCALRYRPDLYMGYHIFPCAVMALVLARLFDRPASYQDTSGPLELEGGGWNAENRVLTALQRPSALVERLAIGLVREFDSVVVRGSGAEAHIRRIGYRRNLAIITGSVKPRGAWRDFRERTIDLAYVGRLTEYKRPDRFIAVAVAVARAIPGLRAVVVGDGPDADAMKSLACQLGVQSTVMFTGKRADVDDLLAMTRVFVLTSRWEGVSIAMLEAMAAGAVPVVANVGDLADSVRHETNGFVVAEGDVAAYARAASRLLTNEEVWRRCSMRAVESSMETCGVDAVARRWERHLQSVIATPRRDSAVALAGDGNDPEP